jgi:hypothetical protein
MFLYHVAYNMSGNRAPLLFALQISKLPFRTSLIIRADNCQEDGEKGMVLLLYRPSVKCCPIAALHFRSDEDIGHSAKPHLYTFAFTPFCLPGLYCMAFEKYNFFCKRFSLLVVSR